MSSFMVSKKHIIYLVNAMLTLPHGLSWCGNEEAHWLKRGDFKRAVEIAELLNRENSESLLAIYGESEDLYDFKETDFGFQSFDAIQVLKAVQCFDYQVCDAPNYEINGVHSLLLSLQNEVINLLPNYKQLIWHIV